MFRRIAKNLSNFAFRSTSTLFNSIHTTRYMPHMRKIAFSAIFPTYMYMSQYQHFACQSQKQPKQVVNTSTHSQLIEKPRNFWEKIKLLFFHIVRFIHLTLIFLPPLLLFPLKVFKLTEQLWLKIFVNSVENAGVVWIKAFQYLSHRRDVIGQEMADNFMHLRQNAPQHSFLETKKNFKRAYGKNIEEIFEEFDEIPIASGSVSQVYKAIYKGKKVAVKVRHPEVDKYIQRDVNIMFFISRTLALFSSKFEIPVGEDSLKKTLIDQIDFNIEKDNLNLFNQHFKGNKEITFPQAYDKATRDSVLVESFAEGVPITYFENNKHALNAVIARLGATTFFEMLMKNNFIHADCHGGNILVEITKKSTTFFGEIWQYLKEKVRMIECKWGEELLQSDALKKLYKSTREEEQKISKIIRECTEKVKITLIDVGMVIRLEETDRQNFISFIKSIIEGNSDKCASLIYSLSNFQGKKIISGKFHQYEDQLNKLFSVLNNKSIFDIEGIQLLIGMLDIIRDNNMKLDGEFATLLTNMVVLEAIAKEIDPEIQILKCAVPYFKYVKTQDSFQTVLLD